MKQTPAALRRISIIPTQRQPGDPGAGPVPVPAWVRGTASLHRAGGAH